MIFRFREPKKFLGVRVSSIVPLFINLVALFFLVAGLASNVYESPDKRYSMWRYENKTGDEGYVRVVASQLDCPEAYVRLIAAAIYHVAAVVFVVLTLLVNIFDVFGKTFVAKAHGILITATMFLAIIGWIITVSMVLNGVCANASAPLDVTDSTYGASQATEIVGIILCFFSAVFTYSF
jgi:hypothetical protein